MGGDWGVIAAATAVAWGGALTAAFVREAAGRVMRPLIYLALVFFGLSAIFDILPQSKLALSWTVFGGAVASGYLLFWLVGRYVAPICPACALRTLDDHHHAHGTGFVVLTAVLGVHCLLDGLGMMAASAVAPSFGLRVFGTIAVHKLPEGFALALMLMMSGRSAWRAFLSTAAIEACTFVGAATGVVWVHPSAFWLAVVLAHIGGTFLYLSASGLSGALAPEAPVVAVRPN